MIRRFDNPTTYKIETERAFYSVTLERQKNNANGNPRYKAIIIVLQVKGEPEPQNGFYTVCFSFSGHYQSEKNECEFIVNHYESLL